MQTADKNVSKVILMMHAHLCDHADKGSEKHKCCGKMTMTCNALSVSCVLCGEGKYKLDKQAAIQEGE